MSLTASQLGPIDHIGIAVSDLKQALSTYADVLGFGAPIIEDVPDQKVRTAIFPSPGGRIELLEATAPDSPIAKFIARRGQGIHHVAVRVDDIDAKLAELAHRGVRLIDKTPRVGAGGHRIAFIHPDATGGVLLELCQHIDTHH